MRIILPLSLIISLCFAAVSAVAQVQPCNELFFSEYIEGSFNNKAMEIYNPTNNAIDLSGYRIIRWNNGNNIFLAQAYIGLSGTLAAKDVAVFVLDKQDCTLTGQDTCVFEELRNKADFFLCPDYNTSYAMYHNGDDALSLNKNDGVITAFGASGTFVDIFGKIGEDPGESWTATAPYTDPTPDNNQNNNCGPNGFYDCITKDHSLYRRAGVQNGLVGNPSAFNPMAEWDTLPRNTFNHLGWHECQCGNTANGIENVSFQHSRIIYPNPVQDHFYINSKNIIGRVAVYNMTGQLVAETEINQQQGEVWLPKLPSGAYTVKTTFADNTVGYDKIMVR